MDCWRSCLTPRSQLTSHSQTVVCIDLSLNETLDALVSLTAAVNKWKLTVLKGNNGLFSIFLEFCIVKPI